MNYLVIMIQEIMSQNFMSKQNAGEEMQINFASSSATSRRENAYYIVLRSLT